MKRLLSIAAIAAAFTFSSADTFNLNQGWNLVGVSPSSGVVDIHKTFDNSNIKVVWSYHQGQWYGYSPNSNIENLITKNGFGDFSVASGNVGFWVYATNPVNISTSANDVNATNGYVGNYLGQLWNTPWYKTIQYYNGDERYKNGIVDLHDEEGYIYLHANKISGISSRAQATTPINALSVNAKVNLINVGTYSAFQLWGLKKDIKNQKSKRQPMKSMKNT